MGFIGEGQGFCLKGKVCEGTHVMPTAASMFLSLGTCLVFIIGFNRKGQGEGRGAITWFYNRMLRFLCEEGSTY